MIIHVEYPYRASRRIHGIVRARAWYGAGLGDYSSGDLFMILRRNLSRAYRASGALFSITPVRPEFSKKHGIFSHTGPKIGEKDNCLLVGLYLSKRDIVGLTGSGRRPPSGKAF